MGLRNILLAVLVSFSFLAKAQNQEYSKNLKIEYLQEYQQDIKQHPDTWLVEILLFTGIRLDIRYATANNFMHRPMYTQARAFVRQPVYDALLGVQEDLNKQGLGLKIFDGYRPYSITVKFYEMAHDTNFVANPRTGSKHNRGCAVDLTIINLKTGKELQMPTGYDSFLPAAAANYRGASSIAIQNRELLQKVMLAHNFQILPTEWWHFDFIGWDKFALMDIPFGQL